jgi:O-antigen biosynthesis protein
MTNGTDVDQPLVSIVIPTYNKVELTLPCLQALAENTTDEIPYEVIIVDNASHDGTRDLLAQLEGDVRFVLNDVNEGFGKACNKGASMSEAEFVLFLNNDTQVLPGWLEPLTAAMRQDLDLAAVQPRLLYPDGRLNSAGDLVFRDQAWNYGKGASNPRAPQFSGRRAPDYASGAVLLVRRSMFVEIGGFDDRYAPAYYEDTYLSFSFRAKGWKVLYEPRSDVIHMEGGTAGTELTSEFKRTQMELNKQKFWDKWADELRDRPAASLDIIEAWAHRDQGKFNPLPYDD